MQGRKPSNCNEINCIIKWRQRGGKSQQEEDNDIRNTLMCSLGNIGLQHCDNSNCHNIYWRGVSGNTCVHCKKRYCSSRCGNGKFDKEGQYYCEHCTEFLINSSDSE